MGSIPGSTNRTELKDPDADDIRGRRFGIYQGFVMDRADPDKNFKVRIQIPSLLQASGDKSWFDWAESATPFAGVPPLGASVWVEFEQGYIQNPIYKWGWFGTPPTVPFSAVEKVDPTWISTTQGSSVGFGIPIDVTLPADPAIAKQPVYPYNKVFQSESGVIVEIDDSPGQPRFRIYHPAGTTILIDDRGSVQIRSAGNIDFVPGGDMQILLKPEASFKVVYPNSSGFVVGKTGIIMTGPQVNMLGRAVNPGFGNDA